MKYAILLLLLSHSTFCRTFEQDKVSIQEALSSENFTEAKRIYKKWLKSHPENKELWFNLASIELYVKQTDSACLHFFEAYKLNHPKAKDMITKNCPNFKNGQILSITEVDQMPRFIYEGKEYELCTGSNLTQEYYKIMIKKLKQSKILKKRKLGKIYIQIHFNKNGLFDGKIVRLVANKEDQNIVSQEILNIFAQTVQYLPAKKNGMSVELWEKWSLPIDFGN